jgi:uncharacterized membrane protein
MIWLLMIVLTPFATKLLTSIGRESAGRVWDLSSLCEGAHGGPVNAP